MRRVSPKQPIFVSSEMLNMNSINQPRSKSDGPTMYSDRVNRRPVIVVTFYQTCRTIQERIKGLNSTTEKAK